MKRIQILDYARFAAALAVILFHYTYNGIRNGKIDSITHIDSLVYFTRYGHLGVEFFFMISGYVIFFSARYRDAPTFACSRAKRLYPAYWAAIIFTSIFALYFGGELMAVNPKMIIANFSMVQNYLGTGSVDGVYWTLFYELRFYLAVFLILFFGLKKWLTEIFLLWPFMIIGFRYLHIQNANFLLDYHYLYFAAGGIFALVTEKASAIRVSTLIITFISCVYFGSSALTSIPEVCIIVSFFAFFTVSLIPKVRDLNLPLSQQCGAITYPLYLIHAHFGYMMLSSFATDSNKWFTYPAVILIVVLVAWSLHYFVEIRLASFWKQFFATLIKRPLLKLTRFFSKNLGSITRRCTQRR